jgi:predicted RNase H-like nuclease (RuvC/YqgF family)
MNRGERKKAKYKQREINRKRDMEAQNRNTIETLRKRVKKLETINKELRKTIKELKAELKAKEDE